MNYIQRLFDSAAPALAASNAPIAPRAVANSPIMAADPRLGIFPGLVDPFNPQPKMDPPPQSNSPVHSDPPAPSRGNGHSDLIPLQHRDAPQTTPTFDIPKSKPQHPVPSLSSAPIGRETAPSTPINPLQRLVESDPLPRPETTAPTRADPAQTAASVAVSAAVSAATSAAISAAGPLPTSPPNSPAPITGRSPAEPPAPWPLAERAIANPTAITVDQFSPHLPDTASTPDQPAGAPVAPMSQAAQPQAAEPQAALAPADPAQPSPAHAPSPFARTPDLPAPMQQAHNNPAPPPERIIERIREVPVAPAPAPKPMTAAAQSVIGPLSQRSFGWQPRQGGV